MSIALGILSVMIILGMALGMAVLVAFTAGPFLATYKYELEAEHLRIDMLYFGKLPFPGLKIPYENIESVASSMDRQTKLEFLRFSYASIGRLFNGVTITLKKRICFNTVRMILIAPRDPDAFITRLRAKL